nr:hypothetical protein [Escherichia coli]
MCAEEGVTQAELIKGLSRKRPVTGT